MNLIEEIIGVIVLSSLIGLLAYTETIKFEKVFKIKWELIINIIFGVITIIAWSILEKNDYRTWLIAIIPTVLFISTLINYSRIKEIRIFLLETW